MANNNSWDQLIVVVEGKPQIDASYQVAIPVQPGWFNKKHAIVSRARGPQGLAHGVVSVPLSAPEKDWTLALFVHYEARVSDRDRDLRIPARKIVDELVPGAGPRANFERRVHDFVWRHVHDRGGLAHIVPVLEQTCADIRTEMAASMSRELSLDVVVTQITVGPPPLPTRAVDETFTFHAADCPGQELKATVRFQLEKIGALAIVHAPRLNSLCADLVALARARLRETSLHDLELARGEVERRLREELSQRARTEGRLITHLALHYASPFTPAPTLHERIGPFSLEFARGVDFPDGVKVECELQLDLVDFGQYVARNRPALESWARDAFRTAVERDILDVSYVDLFLTDKTKGGFAGFDAKVALAKAAIERQASAIGYAPRLVAMRTDLAFDEARRGFKIALEAETFPLSIAPHEAVLDVELTARIHRDEVIRELFQRNVRIREVIAADVREAIRAELRNTTPEEYFVYFSEEDSRGTQSVLDRLHDAVELILRERFRTKDVSLSFHPRPSPPQKLFEELRKDDHAVHLTVARAGLTFTCTYRVKSLSRKHWAEFVSRQPTIDQVKAMVLSCLIEWFNNCDRDQLIHTPDTRTKQSLNHPQAGAFRALVTEFGLQVLVMTLVRWEADEETVERTELTRGRVHELGALDGGRRDRMETLTQQITALRAEAEALAAARDLTEFERVRETIRKLEEEHEALRKASMFAPATNRLRAAAAAAPGTRDSIVPRGVDLPPADTAPALPAPPPETGKGDHP